MKKNLKKLVTDQKFTSEGLEILFTILYKECHPLVMVYSHTSVVVLC